MEGLILLACLLCVKSPLVPLTCKPGFLLHSKAHTGFLCRTMSRHRDRKESGETCYLLCCSLSDLWVDNPCPSKQGEKCHEESQIYQVFTQGTGIFGSSKLCPLMTLYKVL